MASLNLQVSPASGGYPLAPARANPFLFSVGAERIDLYPILRDGANMHSIRARLAPKTGDNLRGYPAIYHRLLRFLKRLEKDGYLVSEKGVFALGMDEKPCYWWRPTHAGLYLIRQVQNSNLCKLPHDPDILEGDTIPRQTTRPEFQTRYPHEDPAVPAEEIPGWVRFPKRSSLTRLKAASLLCQIRNTYNPETKQRLFERVDTGRTDPTTGKPITVVNPELQAKLAEVREYYDYYLEEIEDKTIILVNKDAETPTEEDFKTLPYRTRFNDFSRSARALDQYEAAWEEAEKFYSNAVFLTLTTDPKMHETLWRANRHMSVAWNRYTALLDKRARDAFADDLKTTRAAILKKQGYTPDEIETLLKSDDFKAYIQQEMEGRSFRPKYVAVNEFMQNGLIHMHIIIFGTSWLAWQDKISEDWKRCGQGQIVKAIATHRNQKTGIWEWDGQRPDDARKDESPRDYLKKYLHKAILDRRGFELYWAVNKNFMSASRRMDPARLTIEEEVEIWYQKICEKIIADQTPSYWRYAFCCADSDIPTWMDWYDRKNRRTIGPAVLVENLTGTASAPPPLLTANERRIEHLRRKGLLTFRTALELRRSTIAERQEPEKNPETGRPWSLADFM